MSRSTAIGSICFLLVLTGCGGRSESDLARGAKNLGLVPDGASNECVGRVLADSGLSDKTLDILEGVVKPGSYTFPKGDESSYVAAMAKIEAEC